MTGEEGRPVGSSQRRQVGEGGVQEPREAALLGGARLSLPEAPGARKPLGELGPRSAGSLALRCGHRTIGPPAMGECAGWRPWDSPGLGLREGGTEKKVDVARPLLASLSPPVSGLVLGATGRGRGGTWRREPRVGSWPGRSGWRGRNKASGFPGHRGPRVAMRGSS